jgi:putative endonuclease
VAFVDVARGPVPHTRVPGSRASISRRVLDTQRAAIRDLYVPELSATLSRMADRPLKVFFVYITASRPRGVIYIGMTSDLRAWEHRERILDGFTKRYWAGRLVYFEEHDNAESAVLRERQMKRWRRDWKIELIEAANPTWADLFGEAVRQDGFEH